MKKKIALILAIIFSLGAFALTACKDKKEEVPPPRELDFVEEQLVGKWTRNYDGAEDDYYIFHNNGKWERMGASSEFYHDGEGVETDGKARGHYYIIKIYSSAMIVSEYALFDAYPDTLMYMSNIYDINGEYIGLDINEYNIYIRKSTSDYGSDNVNALDSVEQAIVGTWKHQNNDSIYSFDRDGKYSLDGSPKGKFVHNGDGQDELFGHYNVVKLDYDAQYRIYDFSDGVLYYGSSHKPLLIKDGHRRILHNCEKTILGSWQSAISKNTQYKFNADGTFNCTSWQSNSIRYFYIMGEGTHNKKGHYYIFTFPDTGLSDWRIYDNDPTNLYQNTSGAKIATLI